MLTKEECETALSKLWDNTFGTDCITGEDLDKYVDIIDGLIQYVFTPQPYKFEDLKKGMWVWDDKFKDCMKIKIVFKPCKLYPNGSFKAYHDLNEEELNFVEFEEGRFFPVTKALEYQE